MAHVRGECRQQLALFPQALDELVGPDHPVRVIDAFVDGLALADLGFSKVVAEATGRPPYEPGDLLKLYVYGYLNQVRSSRRLEREAQRNVEVMWLIGRLTPAFKTIADFRKDHPQAIVAVCQAFTRFCREQSLFGAALLAIDGTKIAAVASRKAVITPQQLARKEAAIADRIAGWLAAMDAADRGEPGDAPVDVVDVAAAVAALQEQRERLQRSAEALARSGLRQQVVSEPQARLMRTPHGHQVAYNAQIAVDAEHHLIVAFDLTSDGNDQRQLQPMAVQGQQAVGGGAVTVVADAGYSNGAHGAACAAAGITAIVPRAATVNPAGKQYFSRDRFAYDAASDSWRCPAGATLVRHRSRRHGKKEYTSKACRGCALKPHCTKAAQRVIVRDVHEEAREAMHRRAIADPVWMKHRRSIVEHPFGTMKWLMGHPRFLVAGRRKARAELALTVLGYNLKRVIAILGVAALLQALRPCPQ
jgi:transposase